MRQQYEGNLKRCMWPADKHRMGHWSRFFMDGLKMLRSLNLVLVFWWGKNRVNTLPELFYRPPWAKSSIPLLLTEQHEDFCQWPHSLENGAKNFDARFFTKELVRRKYFIHGKIMKVREFFHREIYIPCTTCFVHAYRPALCCMVSMSEVYGLNQSLARSNARGQIARN